jgi:hypothetical protein
MTVNAVPVVPTDAQLVFPLVLLSKFERVTVVLPEENRVLLFLIAYWISERDIVSVTVSVPLIFKPENPKNAAFGLAVKSVDAFMMYHGVEFGRMANKKIEDKTEITNKVMFLGEEVSHSKIISFQTFNCDTSHVHCNPPHLIPNMVIRSTHDIL